MDTRNQKILTFNYFRGQKRADYFPRLRPFFYSISHISFDTALFLIISHYICPQSMEEKLILTRKQFIFRAGFIYLIWNYLKFFQNLSSISTQIHSTQLFRHSDLEPWHERQLHVLRHEVSSRPLLQNFHIQWQPLRLQDRLLFLHTSQVFLSSVYSALVPFSFCNLSY